MVKDQYFVLSVSIDMDNLDPREFEIAAILNELGAARDYAKQAARSITTNRYLVVQRLASFSAFVAVNEAN